MGQVDADRRGQHDGAEDRARNLHQLGVHHGASAFRLRLMFPILHIFSPNMGFRRQTTVQPPSKQISSTSSPNGASPEPFGDLDGRNPFGMDESAAFFGSIASLSARLWSAHGVGLRSASNLYPVKR
jgi:hypothetical protein